MLHTSESNQLRYNLQLFAKDGPGGEKTEAPTPKKLKDARKEGQVAKSMDLVTAFMLLGLFLGLKLCVGYMGIKFLESFKKIYGSMSTLLSDEINRNILTSVIRGGIIDIVIIGITINHTSFK